MNKMTIQFKSGQVLNFKSTGFFGKTISMGLGNYWTHTAWIHHVKGDKIYLQEALGSRTKKVSINEYDRSYLETLFNNNKLKVMDFGIPENEKFRLYCALIDGTPYDYYTIAELFFTRVLTLFGVNPRKFLTYSLFSRLKRRISPYFTSEKRVDCSEAIARGIAKLTHIDVLKELSKTKFDLVTPQDISLLYDRLKTLGKL